MKKVISAHCILAKTDVREIYGPIIFRPNKQETVAQMISRACAKRTVASHAKLWTPLAKTECIDIRRNDFPSVFRPQLSSWHGIFYLTIQYLSAAKHVLLLLGINLK
jgi:hypothetical protein